MLIPTEPIGSIPRRKELIDAMGKFANGELSKEAMDSIFESEVRSTIEEFEATGDSASNYGFPWTIGKFGHLLLHTY